MERNAHNRRLEQNNRPAIDPDELEKHLQSLRESIALTQELLAKSRATLAGTETPAEEDAGLPAAEGPTRLDEGNAA